MKKSLLSCAITISGLLLIAPAFAHDPAEHAKTAEAPDCAAMKNMDHAKMDMNDPVMQAMMRKCSTKSDHVDSHKGMEGMDHEKMKGMAQDKKDAMESKKMKAMDHKKMDAMDSKKMEEKKMKAMDHQKINDMDHEHMDAMAHKKMKTMAKSKAASSANH